MAEKPGDRNTDYHSIVSDNLSNFERPERSSFDLGNGEQESSNRGWLLTILLQFLAALWLVPILALLYLNFTQHIIGASAWCPDGHCYLDMWSLIPGAVERNLHRFDKDDHNLLGGLQFVAKGLEIWFCIIAFAFMYLITMRMAGSAEGLPIGYLTRPFEFTDFVSLFDPLLWKTGPSPFGANKTAKDKRLGWGVFFLVSLSVFLCVISNLMGPATAVLVLPSLQWISTEKVGNRTFVGLNAARPPDDDANNWFWWATSYCSDSALLDHNYTCTQSPFGDALDTWLSSSLAQGFGGGSTLQDGLSIQLNNTFDVTSSSKNSWLYLTDYTYWAPSRQIISNLSTDSEVLQYIGSGWNESATTATLMNYRPDPYDTYVEYNKSLQLVVERNGPVTGSILNMWAQYDWYNPLASRIEIDDNRQIKCYPWYNLYWTPLLTGSSSGNYTKCIRTGAGWSQQNKQVSFSANGSSFPGRNGVSPGVNFTAYSSDRAVFFPNGTLPSWLPPACMKNGSISDQSDCDWNRLFTIDPASPLANRSANISTIEMNMFNGNHTATLVVDFVAMLNFTTYSFNPSPEDNPLQLVQTQNLPEGGTSVAVDPAWILAAYSTSDGGVLAANRTTTNLVLEVMQEMLTPDDNGNYTGLDEYSLKQQLITLVPPMHALTLIDHNTIVTSDTKASKQDPDHPLLQRNAQMYVWAYGMGSRTAWLGATVAILGGIVVVIQVFLGLFDRRRYRSLTQLLVAALEHAPRGEFEDRREEKQMARTRFHVRDNVTRVGKFSFKEPSDKGSLVVDRT